MNEKFHPGVEGERREFDKIDTIWTEGFENPRLIRGKSGKLSLGTEVGGRSENEDALFLDTESDAFAVVDGMGGYEMGEVASRIVAEEIQTGVKQGVSFEEIHLRSHQRMQQEGLRLGGACYAAGKIEKKKMTVWSGGDCQIVVVDKNGNIKFESNLRPLSTAPRGSYAGKPESYLVNLVNYDRIIAFTDGLTDGVDLKYALEETKDMKVDEAVKQLSKLAKEGMEDGLVIGKPTNLSNRDNITVLVYEILPVPLR